MTVDAKDVTDRVDVDANDRVSIWLGIDAKEDRVDAIECRHK